MEFCSLSTLSLMIPFGEGTSGDVKAWTSMDFSLFFQLLFSTKVSPVQNQYTILEYGCLPLHITHLDKARKFDPNSCGILISALFT